MWLLFALAAHAAPYVLADAGRPGTGPVALIVETPGVPPQAYGPMVEALEDAGLDAWRVAFPTGTPGLDEIVHKRLPEAAAALPRPVAVLVGHGLGGTVAALGADAVRPHALALLGAPLELPHTALFDWLAEQPIPIEGVDLARDFRWHGTGVLDLLWGANRPALGRVGATWLHDLAGRVGQGPLVTLDASRPTWVGVGTLDRLAPPEAVHPWVGGATFVRFGRTRFDPVDPDHAELLQTRRFLRVMAAWCVRHAGT